MRHTKLCALICLFAVLLCSCENDSPPATVQSNSATELNYFYTDYMNDLSTNWYSIYMLTLEGYVPSLPANAQPYKGDPNKTWGDYFVEEALKEYCDVNALCEEAKKAGYILPPEDQTELANAIDTIEQDASMYGFSSPGAYLRAAYFGRSGYRINMDTFDENLKKLLEISKSNNHYTTDNALIGLCNEVQEYEAGMIAEDAQKLGCKDVRKIPELVAKLDVSFDQAVFLYDYELTLAWAKQEGTYDPKVLFEKVSEPFDELNSNFKPSPDLPDGYIYYAVLFYAQDLTDLRQLPDHLFGPGPNVSVATFADYLEKCSIARSYSEHYQNSLTYTPDQVEAFAEGSDAYDGLTDQNLVSIRHILISYQGGTSDESTGGIVYSDQEKKAAMDKILEIQAEWEAGEQSEARFGELAQKHTDNTNEDQGGLYENIYPGWAVEPFDSWCFSPDRKSGDVGIVQTDYGCHLIYFVNTQEETARTYFITEDMRQADTQTWRDTLADAWGASHEMPDTSRLNTTIELPWTDYTNSPNNE